MTQDRIFCKILAGEIPSDKVYENDSVYAFRDIEPLAPTHVLIIPKRHLARLSELEASDAALMGEIILAAKEIAKQEGVNGFRLVSNDGEDGGQVVFHIHFHLLAGRQLGWPPG